jgi:hypothetical protein
MDRLSYGYAAFVLLLLFASVTQAHAQVTIGWVYNILVDSRIEPLVHVAHTKGHSFGGSLP